MSDVLFSCFWHRKLIQFTQDTYYQRYIASMIQLCMNLHNSTANIPHLPKKLALFDKSPDNGFIPQLQGNEEHFLLKTQIEFLLN